MADPTPDDIEAQRKAAETKAAAAEAAKVQAEERKTHVKMTKQGEKPLFVHPTTVAAHEAQGWSQA